MQGLEKALGDLFKKAPPLPESGRSALAKALPWLALIGGVLTLIAVWNIYRLLSAVDSIYASFGYVGPAVVGYGPVIWVGLAVLVVQAVLFLAAFPALRTGKKSGWNMLFWAALVSAVYGVLGAFFDGYINVGQLVFSLLGSAIGLYLLFEVRGHFGGASAPTTKATTTKKQ